MHYSECILTVAYSKNACLALDWISVGYDALKLGMLISNQVPGDRMIIYFHKEFIL